MGFDSVFVSFVAALFLDRITLRRSGGLLYWAAVKKHRGSQKLLNWNTETLKTLANTRNGVASEAQQETQRTETTKNPEKKPNYCDETKIGQLRKKGEYWSEERGESRDVLKGCESVKEEDRIVEEEEKEEVVKMMTNVGIYEFNAKDLIGHGAFAVVYKGRLKSVSCATLFQISAVCCVYFSQQRQGSVDLCFRLQTLSTRHFRPALTHFQLRCNSTTADFVFVGALIIDYYLSPGPGHHWLLIIFTRTDDTT